MDKQFNQKTENEQGKSKGPDTGNKSEADATWEHIADMLDHPTRVIVIRTSKIPCEIWSL